MNIENLVVRAIEKAISGESKGSNGAGDNFLEVGKSYFIRTVTYHYTGRLERVTPDGFLVLSDCAWIADSGRFNNALKTGELSEVEPMPGHVGISAQSIVDVSLWGHRLPTEVK